MGTKRQGSSTGRAPGRLSIRWIVTGAAAALTCASVLSVGAVSERNARRTLTAELDVRLLLEARNLALGGSTALLGDFPELTLHPLVKDMTEGQPELAFAVVVDHEGRIQGHSDARRLGATYAPPEGLAPAADAPALGEGEVMLANRDVRLAQTPVTDRQGRPIGRAIVAMKRSHVDGLIASARRQQLVVLGVFLAVGVVAAFLLMSFLFRPLAPLREGIERVGRGDLDTPIELDDRTELGLLASTVNDMAGALKRAQAEMIERERLTHEVGLARRIQRSLLPAKPWSGLGVTVQGDQRAASEVGGDYYDILPLEDGRVAIAIADVSGKGLAGCLVMTMVSSLLRAFREVYDSPSAMLAALDERLGESLQPGVFVTMFYGVLDPRRGRIVFASAGHNPMLVFRSASGEVERITSKGVPLAAVRGGMIRRTLEDQTITLQPGDLMVEYTDGYSEAPARADESELGIDRLAEVVGGRARHGVAAVLTGLRQVVQDWSAREVPYDDETLLVIGRDPSARDADVVPAPAGGTDADAVALLGEAESRGAGIRLAARLDALGDVLHWIGETPLLRDLRGHDAKILGTALYEVCANIVEHGYHEDAEKSYELWWLPAPAPEPAPAESEARAAWTSARVRDGRFVIRDDGAPFRPEKWAGSDFTRAEVWKRGRGFGLDILHRAMRELTYHPGTARGNITLLAYGPTSLTSDARKGAAV